MKKFLLVLLFMIFCINSCYASIWVEIFEKQYLDVDSIVTNETSHNIKFWIKALRKNPKDMVPMVNKPYWYTLNLWNIDCENRYSRIESIYVYGLKNEILYSDSYIPDWNAIAPDTYAEGYYRLFCLLPFKENPIINR